MTSRVAVASHPFALETPDAADEAVVQDRAVAHAAGSRKWRAPVRGDDARAIVVGEEDVVVLGQEAGRSRGLRIGARGLREVEELAAARVPERPEPRAEPVDHVA